jgi:hypothetical protein
MDPAPTGPSGAGGPRAPADDLCALPDPGHRHPPGPGLRPTAARTARRATPRPLGRRGGGLGHPRTSHLRLRDHVHADAGRRGISRAEVRHIGDGVPGSEDRLDRGGHEGAPAGQACRGRRCGSGKREEAHWPSCRRSPRCRSGPRSPIPHVVRRDFVVLHRSVGVQRVGGVEPRRCTPRSCHRRGSATAIGHRWVV